MSFGIGLLASLLGFVSCCALYQSASSIPKLRKYERKAEKAAEWSSAAEKRLWDTRYTVGTGFVSALLSLLTALAFLALDTGGLGVAYWRVVWPAGLAVGLRRAMRYMDGFWKDKAKVPLLDDYNAAISQSIDVISFLDGLSVGWGVAVLFKLVGY